MVQRLQKTKLFTESQAVLVRDVNSLSVACWTHVSCVLQGAMTVESFLILPVQVSEEIIRLLCKPLLQRVPRYEMLLKELSKATAESSEEYKIVKQGSRIT